MCCFPQTRNENYNVFAVLLCNLNFQTGNTGVHDTVVNQLLAKIDGVEQLNNILVIGEEIFFCLLLFIYQ